MADVEVVEEEILVPEDEQVDAVAAVTVDGRLVSGNGGIVSAVNPEASSPVAAWAELVVAVVDEGCPIEGNNGNVNSPKGDTPEAEALLTDNPGDENISGTAPEAGVASVEVDPLLAGFGDLMNTNGAGVEETGPPPRVVDPSAADIGGNVNTIGVIAEGVTAAADEADSSGTETVCVEETPGAAEVAPLLAKSAGTVSEMVVV